MMRTVRLKFIYIVVVSLMILPLIGVSCGQAEVCDAPTITLALEKGA